MNFLIYILVYPLIWIISILPFRILYFVSDIFYILVFYIIGYRKTVVLNNLKLAFPNKTEQELLRLRKKFYHHFVDIFMEMIKSFTISEKEINNRYAYTNTDFLNTLFKDRKSVILISSHYANWEWILNLSEHVKYKCVGAYTKIANPYFNRAVLKSRGRFGVELVQTSKTVRAMINFKKENVQAIYGLLSDQSPQIEKTLYWGEFLGARVPIHTGGEILAKKFDMNMVFMDTKKLKRGHYESTFSLISNETKKHANFQLTDLFIEKMEDQIKRQPEFYFWTHKRFKHMDKAPF